MGVKCPLRVTENLTNSEYLRKLTMERSVNPNSISDFYRNANVLITGGTGFVGKVLVEKLLRSCEEIGTVYLLMRPKKGVAVEDRLKELLKCPVFNRIRDSRALSKIKAVAGDVALANLGIENQDKLLLIDTVDIVFHSAATVRFDQDLKHAIVQNALGTERLLELCKKMKFLKSFVHVSTAFSNADKDVIGEKIYKPSFDPNAILKFIDFIPEETMNSFTKKLLGKHPNTYTLTKAMAEYIVYEHSSVIPSAIVRPSIITPAVKEPYPGWVDNLSGITGIFMECSRGTIRSIVCNENCHMHLVPVDVVVNTLISSAWYISVNRSSIVKVFNCTNETSNPISWRAFKQLTLKSALGNPSKYITWYPNFSYTTNKTKHVSYSVLFHLIPSALLDLYLFLVNRKPIMFKISQKFHSALLAGSFFSTNEWMFETTNTKNLIKAIKHMEDGSNFEVDLSKDRFDWNDYVWTFNFGVKRYILKDDDKNLDQAKKKLQRLYWFQRFLKLFSVIAFIKLMVYLLRYFVRI